MLSEKRNGRITASAIGAILGVNPYQTADDTMRTMVRSHFGATSEFTGNDATEHGHVHESSSIDLYSLANDVKVERDPDFVIHPKLDWLGCTPDGLVGDEGLIEVKCPYYAKECYTLEEKPMYLYQIYLQLVCTGRAWCDFYVWLPNDQHCERVYFFQAKKWFDTNFEAIQAFYDDYLLTISDEKLAAPYLEDKEVDKTGDDAWFIASEKVKASKLDVDLAVMIHTKNKAALIEIAKAEDKKCSGNGVMVFKSIRKGAVNYKAVTELDGVNLDDYRKKDSVVWTVR